jgi:putative ABC transport system permease protein
MLKNYFKIAIAVLKRRKFFTFLSLFGISFTITILMVMTAFIDKVVNDNYPDKKRDRSLYINKMELSGKESMNSSPFKLLLH